MLKEERMRRMLEIIDRYGSVTAEQMSQEFYVSLPTIYRDLRELTKRNLIIHTSGHIRRAQEQVVTTPLDFRSSIHAEEKTAISKAALELVQCSSVIFLDASSTAGYLVDHLQQFEDLTVLTNGLITAMLLKQAGIRTYCVGGGLVENSLAVGGRIATEMVSHFQIDTMLFSAHGVNENGFIVDPSEEETSLRRYVLKRAATSIFLCDRSKFGRNSRFKVASLRDVDYLVTDANVTQLETGVKQQVILV